MTGKKNVSANLQHTAIDPAGVRFQLLRTGYAKSAMRRGAQQKPILTGRGDRAVPNQPGIGGP